MKTIVDYEKKNCPAISILEDTSPICGATVFDFWITSGLVRVS